MRRLLDTLRFVFVSPELAAALLPFVIQQYEPDWGSVILKSMREGLSFGLAATALPLGALAFCYKEGSDILDPTGARAVLLEWPDYLMLKSRVIAALAWCVGGVAAALVATWMVANNVSPRSGVSLLATGVLISAVAAGTVALARYRIRELLPSK